MSSVFLAWFKIDRKSSSFRQWCRLIPQLQDEICDVKDRFLPEWLPVPKGIDDSKFLYSPKGIDDDDDDDADFSYLERYEGRVASGHEIIDQVFSTNSASAHTPEARAEANSRDTRVYGMLPPPSTLFGQTTRVRMATGELITVLEGEAIPITMAAETCGWKVGQPIVNRTRFGSIPKWSTVRQRYWKNKALVVESNPNAYEYGNPENIKRMKKGLGPQQLNRKTGQMESM
ncbi:MAG: hypothetical protein WCF65_06520 [Parachlamydiaceae bacterium]